MCEGQTVYIALFKKGSASLPFLTAPYKQAAQKRAPFPSSSLLPPLAMEKVIQEADHFTGMNVSLPVLSRCEPSASL